MSAVFRILLLEAGEIGAIIQKTGENETGEEETLCISAIWWTGD